MSRIKPQLSRSDVREYYEKGELYVGFVATLLWGYAHTNHINNFQKIVATPKEVVEKKLNNMIAELSVDPADMEDYFKNMCYGGKNHIPGLGVSFFTKVFYFTCRIHGMGTWILDSKMWNVAKAFRKAEGNPINYGLSRCKTLDYLRYCVSMNAVCHQHPEIDASEFVSRFYGSYDLGENKEAKNNSKHLPKRH